MSGKNIFFGSIFLALFGLLFYYGLDGNRELKEEVESLKVKSDASKFSCERGGLELEAIRDRGFDLTDDKLEIYAELRELRAKKEWSSVARSGDAGSREQLMQVRALIDNPSGDLELDQNISRLKDRLAGIDESVMALEVEKKELTARVREICASSFEDHSRYIEAEKRLRLAEGV